MSIQTNRRELGLGVREPDLERVVSLVQKTGVDEEPEAATESCDDDVYKRHVGLWLFDVQERDILYYYSSHNEETFRVNYAYNHPDRSLPVQRPLR